MARVEIPVQSWGVLQDRGGNVRAGLPFTITTLAAGAVTRYTDATGSTPETSTVTNDNGEIPGFIDAGTYIVTTGATVKRVEALSASDLENIPTSVTSFGATGDGATDDSAAIQAAIDAINASGGGTLFFPEGTYRVLTTPQWKSNVFLVGDNATINFSAVTAEGGVKFGIKAWGTVGAEVLLSANAVQGQFVATPASVTGLATGDWVQMYTSGANFYPFGDYDANRGEIKKIRSVNAGVLTFEDALYDNYATANSAAIRKITFVENIACEGLRFQGSTVADAAERAISLKLANGFRVQNNIVDGVDQYCIELTSSIRGEVSGNRIRGTFYDGVTGSTFYGIAIVDSTQWVRVSDNHGEEVRHLVVNTARSASSSTWGQPRFVMISGNVLRNSMAGGAGRSFAYEHHGFGEGVQYIANVADGCYSGFNVEGSNVVFARNVIRNYYFAGITLETAGLLFENVAIEDNDIAGETVEGGGTATPAGILLTFSTSATVRNFSVSGNNIGHSLTKGIGIHADNDPAIVEGFVIDNNHITNNDATIGTFSAIRCEAKNAIITNNSAFDTRSLIITTAADIMVKDNALVNVQGDALASTAITLGGDRNWADGNTLRHAFNGIQVNAGVTNCIVANNIMRCDNTGLTDGGTTTTSQNNLTQLY